MKHIVHIYGPCGSGTSTLGREIGRRLRFRFLDTDDFFWLPTDPQYTQKRPLEERLALLEEELDKPGDVVLSGALIPWGNPHSPVYAGGAAGGGNPAAAGTAQGPGAGRLWQPHRTRWGHVPGLSGIFGIRPGLRHRRPKHAQPRPSRRLGEASPLSGASLGRGSAAGGNCGGSPTGAGADGKTSALLNVKKPVAARVATGFFMQVIRLPG